jgi:hypothetical protein
MTCRRQGPGDTGGVTGHPLSRKRHGPREARPAGCGGAGWGARTCPIFRQAPGGARSGARARSAFVGPSKCVCKRLRCHRDRVDDTAATVAWRRRSGPPASPAGRWGCAAPACSGGRLGKGVWQWRRADAKLAHSWLSRRPVAATWPVTRRAAAPRGAACAARVPRRPRRRQGSAAARAGRRVTGQVTATRRRLSHPWLIGGSRWRTASQLRRGMAQRSARAMALERPAGLRALAGQPAMGVGGPGTPASTAGEGGPVQERMLLTPF